MQPKGRITKKKKQLLSYNQVPFLDRSLRSILRFMQENKLMNRQTVETSPIIEQIHTQSPIIESTSSHTEQDIEKDMFYTIKNKYPFDTLSTTQMDVYGFTFSKESNINALHKISPIYISKPNIVLPENYQYVEEPQTYNKPIGPTSFLRNTVPQAPDPTFVNFLQACSN